jgi:hypothetical protein
MSSSSTGGYNGLYDPSSLFARRNLASDTYRMLATTSTVIRNPVICVIAGTTVMFEIDHANKKYPVYLKDSLVNTNPGFDYSSFLALGVKIQAGEVSTKFAYTFSQGGIYVFGESTSLE